MKPRGEGVAEWNNARDGRKNRKALSNLREAVHSELYAKRYPTPTSRDYKDNGKSPAELARNTTTLATLAGGQLNPTWVEWLMGFPTGFTDLEDSETP